MKILAFSDVHVSQKHCRRIVEMSQHVDLVIGAGDFGNIGGGLRRSIGWLKAIEKPAVLVPGNSERFDELQDACQEWPCSTVLHGTETEALGVHIYGVGGGIPVTPFGPKSFDFTEDEARNLLRNCPHDGILVTHSPPKGILDISSSGMSLGSEAIREVIFKRKPKLLICGHIHESSGREQITDQTRVINAGPRGIIVDL